MPDESAWDFMIPRDRYNRPIIVNPDGENEPYTRVSTFCSTLSDTTGIAKWKLRHLAVAMGRYSDLGAMAAGLSYDDDKADIDEAIETALDRIGLNAKANYGTAVHTFTEPGRDFDNVPDPSMRADVEAYDALIKALGITVVETETFIVNDALRCAGTFDHIYEVPAGLVERATDGNANRMNYDRPIRLIGDKKTGQLHMHEHALQLAVYATGSRYNPSTAERAPLDVSQRWGLTIHVPRGEGTAFAYLTDLAMGRAAAELALSVRAWRKGPEGLATVLTPLSVDLAPAKAEGETGASGRIMVLVERAESTARLSELWRTYRHSGWTAEHTEAAKVRALLFDELGARVVTS